MVARAAALFPDDIPRNRTTWGRPDGVLAFVQTDTAMKNDPAFKLAAFAILAGVIAAIVTPAHPVPSGAAAPGAAETTRATE
jgi:hypothetical protein